MAESGASLTYPIRAGEVKKGSHVLIKEHPCKVIEVTTSKTGKHGHAKANITAIDIFEGTKHMDISPTSHNMEAPFVNNTNYDLVDIQDEAGVLRTSLMDEEGNMREDLTLDVEKYEEHAKIKEVFETEGEVAVKVTSAMGRDMIFLANKTA